jgi:hypothetical protein
MSRGKGRGSRGGCEGLLTLVGDGRWLPKSTPDRSSSRLGCCVGGGAPGVGRRRNRAAECWHGVASPMVVVACSGGVLVWRVGDRGCGRSSSVPVARAVVAWNRAPSVRRRPFMGPRWRLPWRAGQGSTKRGGGRDSSSSSCPARARQKVGDDE